MILRQSDGPTADDEEASLATLAPEMLASGKNAPPALMGFTKDPAFIAGGHKLPFLNLPMAHIPYQLS
jgi:hypothetical protein